VPTFYDLLAEGRYDSLAVTKLNEFAENLARDMEAHGPIFLRRSSGWPAPRWCQLHDDILAPQLFQAKLGIDLTDAGTRELFVGRLVDRLF